MDRKQKRKKIIDATLRSMAEKGKETTISEIAAIAGINDSIIYHYFANKQDLLYYAVGEVLQEKTQMLLEHLQGIREPVSKLSKLIWVQLCDREYQSQYMTVSIFECRADMDFLQHDVARYFNRRFNVLKDIIEEGVNSGSFSRDLCIPIACEMIFGLLDMENIQVLTAQRTGDLRSDFEHIINLILPIVTQKTDGKEHLPQKRNLILKAAEAVFAEKGFDKSTTIEIAKSANVAEGTLYEHFENKEDILFSSLDKRFEDHLDSLKDLFETRSPVRKLHSFIVNHFMMYFRHPQFLRTFISEGIYNRRFYQSDSFIRFRKYLEMIDIILEEGQKEGSFRPDLNPRVFKNLFLGTFCNLVLRCYYACSSPKPDIMEGINTVVPLLMFAAVHPDSQKL